MINIVIYTILCTILCAIHFTIIIISDDKIVKVLNLISYTIWGINIAMTIVKFTGNYE